MVGNIFKIIVTLVLGYALGWMLGAMAGAFLGAVSSLFFRELVASNLVILMSISFSALLGGVLGFLAIQISNKIFTASDKPFAGVVIGTIIGLIIVFFMDGPLSVPDIVASDQSFYLLPVIYMGIIGGDIGSIVFAILGVTRVIRDVLENYKETANNRERLEEINISLGIHSSKEEKRG